jgi:hypothetical protein
MDAKVKTIQPRGHGFTQMGPRTVAWHSSVGLASEAALQGGDPYGLASEAALHEWLLFAAREAVGGPGFGADAVVDEEKAGGIVFFFDVF